MWLQLLLLQHSSLQLYRLLKLRSPRQESLSLPLRKARLKIFPLLTEAEPHWQLATPPALANLTLSKGLTGISRTVLVPSSVAINSDIGDNALGQTTINISNLAANGDGGSITPDSESGISSGTIDLEEGTQYASGNAFIEGMGASVLLDIDPGNASAPGEASFFATVLPNINGLDACQPTHEEACPYVTNEDLVSGNTGANASLSTNTNIDINANSFVNTFAQSF